MNNFWDGFTKQAAITNSGRYGMTLLKKTQDIAKPITSKVVALGKQVAEKVKPAADSTFANVTKRVRKYSEY